MIKASPAKLRHRIQLQNRSVTKDTFGQEVLTWSTVVTAWAEVEPSMGRSELAGEAQASTKTHIVTIRYRPGITARMRVLYESRILEVNTVIDVEERHFWLQLECTEGLTQG